jgi:hypothetical protein
MQAIPYKSPCQIKKRASELGVKRDRYHITEERPLYWWTVTYADLQAVAQFTESEQERELLWGEINAIAERTHRGELGVLWFMPLDMVSFVRELSGTVVNDERSSNPSIFS